MTETAAPPEPDVTRVRAFLDRLAADNTRETFQAMRAEYDAALKGPAEAMLAALAPRIEAITGHPAQPKLFRPNRDVRFSADKTPYNTHLHMLWRLEAGGRQDPAVFLGIGRDYVTAGAGIPAFDKAVLADWRRMLDLDADRMGALMAEAEAAGFAFRAPELKRVPPPHGPDHPMERFLRMKGLVATREIGPEPGVAARLLDACEGARPVLAALQSVV